MEKEFIPYEQSLSLKELGFDEPCFGYYLDEKLNIFHSTSANDRINSKTIEIFSSDVITSPTFSQAFRWFREKHKLHSSTFWMEIDKSIYWNYRYSYLNDKSTESVNRSMVYFNTPEEAELKCLKKLIEIVKEK